MAAYCRSGNVKLQCFIDNAPARQNTYINGYPVYALNDALNMQPEEIWIAVLNRDAEKNIKEQITQAGFQGTIRTISQIRDSLDIRLASMRLYAEEIKKRNIPGAIAELGVYKGDFAVELAAAFPNRNLYLFDTFSGFPDQAVKKEAEKGYSRAGKRDFSDTSMEEVLARFQNLEKIYCRPGIFPQTADGLEENFAFVNIDPDLYEPVLAGLTYFYPRMNRGGCIFIHDYNSFQFQGVKNAVDEYCDANHIFVFPLADMHGTVVIIKP